MEDRGARREAVGEAVAVNGNGNAHGSPVPSGPILIGFANALAAPEAAASLLSAGLTVVAFTQRGSRPALRRDRRVSLGEITDPRQSAAGAATDLVSVAQAHGATALMPLDDASLWLCDQVSEELRLPVVGPTGTLARLALDKSLQVRVARDAGLAVPDTHVCGTRDDLLMLDAFPMIVKPALAAAEVDGRLARGSVRVCRDAYELSTAASSWEPASGPMLAQPWVRGTGEGLFGIAVGGEVVQWSAHRRLRMVNPQGSGSSACVSIPIDPVLVEAAGRMMRDVDWHGLFMLEFLRDRTGTPWFMELNGRCWGSLALARRLGLEYPAWSAGDALGLASSPPVVSRSPTDRPLVCRHLGREIVHVLSVLRGPRSAATEDWPSRWSTLCAVARMRRGERWYNWSRRHPALFVEDTVQTVLEAFRRKRLAR